MSDKVKKRVNNFANKKIYLCRLCNFGTDKPNDYAKHLLSILHTNSVKTLQKDVFYCVCCKYYSMKISHFKEHMISQKHVTISGKQFDKNTDLKQFKRTIYCCNNCNIIYMSKRTLDNHIKKCCKIQTLKFYKKINKKK